jgi:hypothetical protein
VNLTVAYEECPSFDRATFKEAQVHSEAAKFMERLRPTLPVSKLRCHTLAIACSFCLAQALGANELSSNPFISDEEFLKSFNTQLFPPKAVDKSAPKLTPQETGETLLATLKGNETSLVPQAISAFVQSIEQSPKSQNDQNPQRKARITVSTRSLRQLAKILERSQYPIDQTIPKVVALLKHIDALFPTRESI